MQGCWVVEHCFLVRSRVSLLSEMISTIDSTDSCQPPLIRTCFFRGVRSVLVGPGRRLDRRAHLDDGGPGPGSILGYLSDLWMDNGLDRQSVYRETFDVLLSLKGHLGHKFCSLRNPSTYREKPPWDDDGRLLSDLPDTERTVGSCLACILEGTGSVFLYKRHRSWRLRCIRVSNQLVRYIVARPAITNIIGRPWLSARISSRETEKQPLLASDLTPRQKLPVNRVHGAHIRVSTSTPLSVTSN